MAKLTRVTGKVFGGSAPLDEIGQFGSALAGDPTNTQDVATIQALPAYSEGWGSAVVSSLNFPPIEEVTGVLKTISYQSCYLLQEGIPEYDANTNYSNTSIVKSVNGDELIFYLSQTNDNLGNPLSDTDHWARAIVGGRASYIGEIVTSTIPLTDAGLHLLDGSIISGAGTYADFVTYIANLYSSNSNASYFCTEAEWQTSISTYGVCGKFVYTAAAGDDPATVRLPKITGFVEGAGTTSSVGNLTQAGLPNIKGWLQGAGQGSGHCDGNLFSLRGTDAKVSNGNQPDNTYNFNAHNYNSIYKDSFNKVQPQSIQVLYYIVIGTTTKTQIQVDIDEIATDLNGKADVDLTNVNDTGTSAGASWAMPSSTYEQLTLGATGSKYTAPANGWFTLGKTFDASGNNYVYIALLDENENYVISSMSRESTAGQVSVYMPVVKGDKIAVEYAAGNGNAGLRFVYAKGSESEA